jgi:hypothetical protein
VAKDVIDLIDSSSEVLNETSTTRENEFDAVPPESL